MVNRRRAHDINEAAARFAETVADSYKVIYGQAAESTERRALPGRSRNSWRATSESRPRAGAPPPPNAYPSRPVNNKRSGRRGHGSPSKRT